jgi:5'-nucleotidase
MGAPHQRRLKCALAVTLGAGLFAAPFSALPAFAAGDTDASQPVASQTAQATTSAPASSESATPAAEPTTDKASDASETQPATSGTADTAKSTAEPKAKIGTQAEDDSKKTLNLLGINDFHGRIDENTVKFAGTVEGLKTTDEDGNNNTAFISAGDNISASLFASSVQDDKPTLDVLNALKLDASATGNHEYDKGEDDLTNRVEEQADFPYLAANVTKNGKKLFDDYAIIDVNGVKVGVVGAVTQEAPTLVAPGGIKGLKFGEPVAAVNKVADQLKDGDASNGEADVVVATYHEGASEGTPDGASLKQELAAGGAFKNIVEKTSPNVAAIFTGHTHKQYAWTSTMSSKGSTTDGKRPVIQTGDYGENVGQIKLTYNTESKKTTLDSVANHPRVETDDAELVAKYPRVAEVKEIVDAALKVAEEKGSVVIGEATEDITTAFIGKDRDDRSSESTLGNLVADSLLDTLGTEERGGADIGVVNPGGLRAELYKGDITYAEANAVLPFVNNLWTTTITGAQFKTALEQQWQTTTDGTEPSRPYLQLGLSKNVSYTYDPDAKLGKHITSITVNGAPIDPKKDYTIGSFSFLLEGGDNFRVFAEGKNTKDTGLVDRDAWIDYLKKTKPVSPDFARHAVVAKGLPGDPVKAGSSLKVDLSKLDLTSLGSPKNTKIAASLVGTSESLTKAADPEIGSASVADGATKVTLKIPADAKGDYQVKFVAEPSGTTVYLPLSVVGASQPTSTDEPTPTDTTAPSDQPTQTGAAGPSENAGGNAGNDGLANTGSDAGPWILGGAITVLLGAGLTVLGTRRKATHR